MAAPRLDLPKGGGAIRGIGETFAANPATGAASLRVPIASSPGRGSFGPQLSLSYDSGAGNGLFGLGWSIDLPRITRRTDRGLPRYDDRAESDVFVLAGAEDLVPVLDGDGSRFEDRRSVPGYIVHRYRPRTEGLFARIERWTRVIDGDVHWRSLSGDNVLSVYGQRAASRVADPRQPAHVFAWLLCERRDDRGNAMVVDYKPEDGAGVDRAAAHQRNRGGVDDVRRGAARHLKRIRYGNRRPLLDSTGARPLFLTDEDLPAADWMFELVVDYGEHDITVPRPEEARPWLHRTDAFSDYRAGFEVRTARLCQRVLMFHHFDDEPAVGRACLVRSTELTYAEGVEPARLVSIAHCGWRRQGSGYLKRSLPSLALEYSDAIVQAEVRDVDPASLAQAPVGLADGNVQWTDLHGEGLPGLLLEQGGAWYYKRNEGPATEGGVAFAAAERVAERPNLAGASTQWMDIGGDGRPDLVLMDDALSGFHEHDDAEGWKPFQPFQSRPIIDPRDPLLRFVDLDGDGRADVLITEDDAFVWHASLAERGFGPGLRVGQSLDDEAGPRMVFADGSQSVYLADMNGDGLTDLVRLRNGEVCYWPNLGFARFGAKVTMDRAPHLDRPERFDQRRVRLADIDGTGTADLIYLGSDGVTLYFNRSGNRWSEGQPLAAFPAVDDVASIQVLDLMGNGTACLVWSSPLAGHAHRAMRYADLMGGRKPHLLTRIVSNLGAETLLSYAPSTRFYLDDRLAGRPWITRLPFPVHVVERVETVDRISGNRFVTRYAYHHGHYDGVEREFRGFGMVEQWDSEEMPSLGNVAERDPASNIDPVSHVPPVLTRRWYHTGLYLGRDRVSNYFAGPGDGADGEYYREPGLGAATAEAMLLEDTVLPEGLDLEEQRQACRALGGSLLREEVYSLDGSAREPHPYSVKEQNFTIRALQRRGAQRHAVYFVHARESLTYQYERNPADPRVSQVWTLDVNDYGQVTRSAAAAYGRRTPDLRLDPADQARQAAIHLTGHEETFTNPVERIADYRLPRQADSRNYEITGVALRLGAARFTIQEIDVALADAESIPFEITPSPGPPQKRLIQHRRTRYRPDDLGASQGDVAALLPLGAIESRGLPGEDYLLALTPGLIAQSLGRRVDDLLLADRGGYRHGEGDAQWWQASGRVFYSPIAEDDPAAEIQHARDHFFLPHRFRDPFHREGFETESFVTYDAYDLAPLETRDALGNVARAETDYRVLQPHRVTDANGNRHEVAFDTLGFVVGSAVMGKVGEAAGDSLAGFEADLEEATILDQLADPLRDPHALLKGASSRLVYDVLAYQRTAGQAVPEPPVVWTMTREIHDADLAGDQMSPLQHRLTYSDGFGREIQAKAQADPGPLASGGAVVASRWIGTGWTVFDNKGQPVRRYEPFFSSTHRFELARAEGVSAVMAYDPPGRVVATLNPNHTWEKVVFDPWRQEHWDVSDTTLIADPTADPDVGDYLRRLPVEEVRPTWFEQRSSGALGPLEQAAAAKAAVHSGTPGVVHLDALGRPFLAVAHNRTQRGDMAAPDEALLATRVTFDIQGNQREVVDALGRLLVRDDYDLLGQRLHSASMEAGERWILADAAARPLCGWDSRGHRLRTEHDPLGRPTRVFLSTSEGDEQLVARTVYGESQLDPERHNLRGHEFQVFDGAGVLTTPHYDFKGNALERSRQFSVDYRTTPDWLTAPSLEPETFTTRTSVDALDRPVDATTPDGSVTRRGYGRSGSLVTLDVNRRGESADGQPVWTSFVRGLDYNARGQLERVAYGNGAVTTYAYDPLTFRLVRRRTEAAGDQVQDLAYTYDPGGNVTHVEDGAQQSIFFRNRLVEPDTDYLYDALSQLIEATGREHLGQLNGGPNPPTPPDAFNRFHTGLDAPGDGNAMGRYIERYIYDAAGNLLEMRHVGSDPAHPGWTRRYTYEEASLLEPERVSNRLSATQAGDGTPERYTYDPHGSMTTMGHLPVMRWDYRDQLQASAQQIVTDNRVPETTYYVYDAGGRRVRKITDRAAAVGVDPARLRERIYVDGIEVYREYAADGASTVLARETLHVMAAEKRVAMVETRTIGDDGSATRLTRFQTHDHLGSTRIELDAEAHVISYEEYFPYGSTSFQTLGPVLVGSRRYRFGGLERDEESGLAHHGARYLAPWIGRWAAADPAGLVDGANAYAYARNCPIGRIDPGGRESFNAGDMLNVERGDDGVVYARYRAREGTWISASMQEQGWGEVYEKKQGYGAYSGMVRTGEGRVYVDPDKVEIGQEYLIPIRDQEAELIVFPEGEVRGTVPPAEWSITDLIPDAFLVNVDVTGTTGASVVGGGEFNATAHGVTVMVPLKGPYWGQTVILPYAGVGGSIALGESASPAALQANVSPQLGYFIGPNSEITPESKAGWSIAGTLGGEVSAGVLGEAKAAAALDAPGSAGTWWSLGAQFGFGGGATESAEIEGGGGLSYSQLAGQYQPTADMTWADFLILSRARAAWNIGPGGLMRNPWVNNPITRGEVPLYISPTANR